MSQAPESKAARDLELQRLIDALVTGHRGRDPLDVARSLRVALEREHLAHVPEPWVRAVAEGAAAGNAYVVSPLTREETEVPEPGESDPAYGVV